MSIETVFHWVRRTLSSVDVVADIKPLTAVIHSLGIAGEPIIFERIPEQLPLDMLTGAALDDVQRMSMKSAVIIPVTVPGQFSFALAVGAITQHRAWPGHFVEGLRLAGRGFDRGMATSPPGVGVAAEPRGNRSPVHAARMPTLSRSRCRPSRPDHTLDVNPATTSSVGHTIDPIDRRSTRCASGRSSSVDEGLVPRRNRGQQFGAALRAGAARRGGVERQHGVAARRDRHRQGAVRARRCTRAARDGSFRSCR